MAHWAKVNNGIVSQVIVAEADFLTTYVDSEPGEWIQTSYNTYGGIHNLGGTPLRKNFAAIGYVYDLTRDAFYSPKPHSSWTLVESSCYWKAPVDYPDDGKNYKWNEDTTNWVEIE